MGFCYKRATGRDIGYGSVQQYQQGVEVRPGREQPGDVFFWDTFGAAPGHNAVYVGDGQVIHVLNERAGVVRGSAHPQDIGGRNRFMGIRDFGFRDGPAPDPAPGPDKPPHDRPPHERPPHERPMPPRRYWQELWDRLRGRR